MDSRQYLTRNDLGYRVRFTDGTCAEQGRCNARAKRICVCRPWARIRVGVGHILGAAGILERLQKRIEQ